MAFIGLNEGFATPQERGYSLITRLRQDLIARFRGPIKAKTAPRRLAGPDPRDLLAQGYLADLDIEVDF